jgi:predicted histidine transporter YuiF (NhaC family)
MTKQRLAYIQVALEAAIPLAGFFAWNWSLYFILLFYIIDLLAGEITMHLKARAIAKYQGTGKEWLRYALIGTGLFIVVLIGIHVMIALYHPDIQFFKELAAFWTYEEMGMQQGYLLTPLVFLLSFQQFRFEFMLPARYRTTDMKSLWQSHFLAMILMVIGCALAILLTFAIMVPEAVYVLAIVVGSAAFSLWKLRQR